MLSGQKHTIRCRCILPQFKKHTNPPVHEFIVFSEVLDNVVQESITQCNNCGIVHKIVDFCKSEILKSKENIGAIQTIDDICFGLPDDLESLLKGCNSDLATFQYVDFVFRNNLWGTTILLTKEETEGYVVGKSVTIVAENRFRVVPFTHSVEIKK